jgi:hypothetical protein
VRTKESERDNTYRHGHTHTQREKQERTTEAMFLNSDCMANLQGERAESAQLALELQQAREIILLLQVSLRWHSVRPNTLVVKASCSSFRPHALVV